MASNCFCNLPDVIILNVLAYLDFEDLVNASKTCRRLRCLCVDRVFVRNISLEGQYHIKIEDLHYIFHEAGHHVRYLNLDHSYWLNHRAIHWTVSKCKHLQSLRLVECKLKIATLVKLVAGCPDLKELSFSISSFVDIKRDVFIKAKDTLCGIRKLGIYYMSREMALMNYFGEQSTLLDCCESLEELYIGSAGMAIPELYRPIIRCPEQLKSLRLMSITSNIHAGAQMMFYGTLSQLPNASISWQTLLMPNVNLLEFVTKSEFRGCLSNMRSMRHLDVSGSKVTFPCDGLDITTAAELQFLNISMTLVTSKQLKLISASCNKLRSINLFGCGYIFQGGEGQDFTGFESLFDCCSSLVEVNIAGAHHHLFMLPEAECSQIRSIFSKIKGLKRLALPVCLLTEASQSHTRTAKRLASSPKLGSAKRRYSEIGVQHCEESADRDGSSSSTSTSTQSVSTHVGAVLASLFHNNPDIEELELLAVNFQSAIHKNKIINPKAQQFGPCVETRQVRDQHLEAISQLKQLRKLTIVGAPGLISGQCLVSIAKKCENLYHLEVGYLGGAMYGNVFSQALRYMGKLRDLRLEQPNLCLNAALFEGLRHCTRLERLCILAKHSTFNTTNILRLVEQLQRLVVVQLFTGETITVCRTLTNTIHKRFIKQRPALSCAIYPLVYDGISETVKSIPAKHFDELTRFQSRVCFLPPDIAKPPSTKMLYM